MLIYRFNKEMAQIELYHNMDDDEPYEVIELDTAVWLYNNIVFCEECKYEPICSHSVQHTTHEPTSVTIGYKSVNFCSYGERREP